MRDYMSKHMPLALRLFGKLAEDSNGCWIFLGKPGNSGYGVIGLGGRADGVGLTHRVAWEVFVGPIPDGLHIDHLCRVRLCCNPAHLEPVTQAVNNQRSWDARPRTACRRGHVYTGDERITRGGGSRCDVCRRDLRAQRKNPMTSPTESDGA